MSDIHIVYGPIGAGKSTYAHQLSKKERAACFSIDRWMVELFQPDAPDSLSLPWVMERVARCEKLIWLTTCDIAENDGNVVLDLGFMKEASRTEFLKLVSDAGFDAKPHFIHASLETRRARVMARNDAKGETYSLEVSPAMFDFMDSQFETATEQEQLKSMVVDTEARH